MKKTLSLLLLFLISYNGYSLSNADSIRVEIRDSILVINSKVVHVDSIVQFFSTHFGEPQRTKKSIRYKSERYIYDDLGISIHIHPVSVSVSFEYKHVIRIDPKSPFQGTISINGKEIDRLSSFLEIQSILAPCYFSNIYNRSLLGTFFSFEKLLSDPKISSIGYHFIKDSSNRIGPYRI
ncbi:hypothetical protein DNU06_17225 [Putridiphycobacter roseus]|uniref:DUF7738 domain-containing protein n=1 Tax=Putridiphycobacter roseus TaxID=2219161 RepID=A0A2W1MWR9_9FLAO|nr:hypothetical protein [Putridiphycobacter roseus]PZE15600.1 hypothetical protein DNU06_17225 [Putridiphycobacter roseus]